jgi:PAS domain S-box-containing protein
LAGENETMAEIGRIIGSTLNIDEIYEGLGEVVNKIIPFDGIVINMIDSEKNAVRIVFAAGEEMLDRKTEKIYPLEGSGNGEMVRTKSSLLIQTEDFEEYKDRFPMLLSTFQAGFRSILDVPLFSQGEIIGGLLLRSRKPYAYTDKDVRVAERIGSQIAGAIANIQLFQERKRIEEALTKREKQYRTLIEGAGQAGEGILIAQNAGDREGGIVFASKAALEMTGYSQEEIRQASWFDIIHPADRPAALIRYRERIEGKHHPGVYEITLVCKGGSTIPIEATAARTEFRDQPAVITFFRDIAKRKQIAEKLTTSEERYRNFFNNAQIGLFQTRISDGRMLEANDRIAQIHGYRSREECIRNYVVSDHYVDPGTRERLLEEIQRTGEVRNFEARLSKKDGTLFWSRFSARSYPEKGYMEGVVVDITEEKLAQEKLRESEERFRRLVENAPLGILSIDVDGNVIDINAPAYAIIGSHAAEGSRAINLFTSSHMMEAGIADQFRRCLETRKAHVFETSYRGDRENGIHLRCYLTPILNPAGGVNGVQALLEDISERMKLEDQLLQAQKMEAIGTLAGGIAHDFNNILTGIMGYAELASWDLTEGSKAKYNIKQSISAAHRAKDLVQQILAFSRQGKQDRRPLDIRPIIKEGLKFLRASIPATIEIRHNIAGDMGIIEADPTQIHQVRMNLCTNAAHAMSERGGLLEVSLSQFDLGPGVKGAYHGMDVGRYLKLRVTDTGHGITPEVLPRIFEPYFTTKEVGKGTGLGLATVHGIVKSYGGGITVSSEPGEGAVFEIYFPRIDTEKEPTAVDQSEPLLLGEQERILFVDDESSIVEINQFLLKHLGYQVEGRTSSIEARELFRAHPDRFDLVITDMTMPNMTGDKLAQELLKIRPGIPIILCTGFSERITADKAKAMGIEEFVTKPLIIYDLAKLIRRALDRRKKIPG